MVSTIRRTPRITGVTPAPRLPLRAQLAGAVFVGVLGVGTLVGTATAAPVDPLPSGGVTCTNNTDCTVGASRPSQRPKPEPTAGNPAPGNGPVEPPLQACIDAVTCELPEQAPPEGQPVTAAQLAQEQFAKLPIKGPQIGIAPKQTGSGLVGLPVWLWTTVNAATWGPYTATAAVPGLTVTAVAKATRITWNMGDGRQVVCRNPGTEYKATFGNTASPTCGYRYARASRARPNGTYTITGTTTWVIHWAGGGAVGVIDQTRQTQIPVRIDELQVVTR